MCWVLGLWAPGEARARLTAPSSRHRAWLCPSSASRREDGRHCRALPAPPGALSPLCSGAASCAHSGVWREGCRPGTERVLAQLRATLGRPGETSAFSSIPAIRTSSPAPVTGSQWEGSGRLLMKLPPKHQVIPNSGNRAPAWGPGPRSREPSAPASLTAACLQGPSSSPTSWPWPSRGSRCSTSSSPSASGCAEAASACGRPSRPTWAELVGACWGPRRQLLEEAGLGAADEGGGPTRVCKETRAAASPPHSEEALLVSLRKGLGAG